MMLPSRGRKLPFTYYLAKVSKLPVYAQVFTCKPGVPFASHEKPSNSDFSDVPNQNSGLVQVLILDKISYYITSQ